MRQTRSFNLDTGVDCALSMEVFHLDMGKSEALSSDRHLDTLE